MKKNTLLSALFTLGLLTTTLQSQTLIPKWSNTEFGPNQIYINGGAFNPTTSNLLVCGSLTHFIDICEPSDGAIIGSLDVSATSGGTYAISGMTIDTNGVIYACNYAAAGAAHLYSWANESAGAVNFANSTLGSGSIGKTMAMYGAGTNAVFILSTTGTGAVYVYYNGTAWTSKQLSVTNLTSQGGMAIASWSSTNCVFITKNSGINGLYNSFNPGSASPITVSQVQYTSAALKFTTLGANATTVQGASAYDPLTGLFAFHTRAVTASPFTISNYLVATFNSNGLAAPAGCSPIVSMIGVNGSSADSANYGADFWGNGVYYSIPCTSSANYGFAAYDISAYKVSDITPASQSLGLGATATLSVVSGGSGTLTYVWQKNGSAITDTNDYVGTSTPTLTISPVSSGDAATYTCTVTGAGGLNWTSGNGVLSISLPPPPAFTSESGSALGSAHFQLNFTGPVGSPYRIWSSSNPGLHPVPSTWTLVTSGSFASGVNSYTDTAASGKAKFYVITSP